MFFLFDKHWYKFRSEIKRAKNHQRKADYYFMQSNKMIGKGRIDDAMKYMGMSNRHNDIYNSIVSDALLEYNKHNDICPLKNPYNNKNSNVTTGTSTHDASIGYMGYYFTNK